MDKSDKLDMSVGIPVSMGVIPLAKGCSAKMVFSNLGICALLLGYTLLGAFLFLAIEGTYRPMQTSMIADEVQQQQAGTATPAKTLQPVFNVSAAQVESWVQETRNRTVENIWDITVSLNILYGENWTRLATSEILKFQEFLIEKLSHEFAASVATITPTQSAPTYSKSAPEQPFQWTFARAFLFSLTTLTTVGYGRVGPRSALGKAVTMGYSILGIPLMLLYLSSVGALLARFTRVICLVVCRRNKSQRATHYKSSNHLSVGSTMNKKNEEPFFVRAGHFPNSLPHRVGDLSREKLALDDDLIKDTPVTLTPTSESSLQAGKANRNNRGVFHGCSVGIGLMFPACMCAGLMIAYVAAGALLLGQWEEWSFLERIYFCFMALSTIGFGDLLPGESDVVGKTVQTAAVSWDNHTMSNVNASSDLLVSLNSLQHRGSGSSEWFCSVYILVGMALTAMCFNICHEELLRRSGFVITSRQLHLSSQRHTNICHVGQQQQSHYGTLPFRQPDQFS